MIRFLFAVLFVLVILFPQPTEAGGKDLLVLNADFVGRQHTLSGDSAAAIRLRVYTSGGASNTQIWTLPNHERPIARDFSATGYAVEDMAATGRTFFDAGFSCPSGGLRVEYQIDKKGGEIIRLHYKGALPMEASGNLSQDILPGAVVDMKVLPTKMNIFTLSQQGTVCGGVAVMPHPALRRQLGLP